MIIISHLFKASNSLEINEKKELFNSSANTLIIQSEHMNSYTRHIFILLTNKLCDSIQQ